jgi:hypothetical protein
MIGTRTCRTSCATPALRRSCVSRGPCSSSSSGKTRASSNRSSSRRTRASTSSAPAIMSDDGLGWVWQCNVFGHYIIVRSSSTLSPDVSSREQCRALEAQLAASRHDQVSAPRASCGCRRSSRAQTHMTRTTGSSCRANGHTRAPNSRTTSCVLSSHVAGPSPTAAVRHITVHPGVVYSLIDAALVGSFTSKVKIIVFYLVRCLLRVSMRCRFAELGVCVS